MVIEENSGGAVTVSVIVPVYMVEPWIGTFIDSLKKQKQPGLEFIFVDDCSPDRSMEIVESWASCDSRVRIIRNERNLGSGASRNAGIREARGEYLSFIDPDDYVSDDFYELLYKKAFESGGHDIAKGSVCKFNDSDGVLLPPDDRQNKRIQNRLPHGTPLFRLFTYEHWTAIFRHSLFRDENVRYGRSKTNQDMTFLLKACYATNDIVLEERAFYCYRIRPDSATNVSALQRTYGELDAFDEMLDYLLARPFHRQSRLFVRERAVTVLKRFQDVLGSGMVSHSECPGVIKRLRESLARVPNRRLLLRHAPMLKRMEEYPGLFESGETGGIPVTRISVIVPVYNPGEGIKDCISSLRRQLLAGLEFIFINDGSTDSSMALVEEWAAQDERVRILYNETNIGAGPSRNRGIEAAKGEYLSFVDSDDSVSPDFYERLYLRTMEERRYDIVKGSCVLVDRKSHVEKVFPQNRMIKRELRGRAPLWHSFYYGFYSAIYRRTLFSDPSIRFGGAGLSEDAVFSLRVGGATKAIALEDNAFYYYVKRTGSASDVSDRYGIEQLLKGLVEKRDVLEKYGNSGYAADYFSVNLHSFCYRIIYGGLSDATLTEGEKRDLLERIHNLIRTLPEYDRIMDENPEFSLLFTRNLTLPPLRVKEDRVKVWIGLFETDPALADAYGDAVCQFACRVLMEPRLSADKLKVWIWFGALDRKIKTKLTRKLALKCVKYPFQRMAVRYARQHKRN